MKTTEEKTLAAIVAVACAALPLFGEIVHVEGAPFAMPDIVVPEFPDRNFVLTDYGAVKGAKSTAAFAAAVAACERVGGGRIVVPPGTWLTGAIRLGSNCRLHLEPLAKIEFTDDPADYPEVLTTWEGIECYNYSPLVFATGATNVAITGAGMLAPRMDFWRNWFDRPPSHMAAIGRLYHWGATNAPVSARRQLAFEGSNMRPHLIQFNRCRNVLLDGFRIRESPFWMIHLYQSEDCVVRNLDTWAHGNNNDGIDIDMTRNVLVENCRFDQGDDGVVLKAGRNADAWRLNRPTENVVIRNVDMVSSHSLLGIGSELSGGIRNVWMTNCRAERTFSLFRIKTGPRRGGFVENVFLDRCCAVQADSVMSLQTDYCAQWGAFPDYELRRTRIANVRISDVTCDCAEYGVKLMGDPLCKARGVTVRNVRVGEVREQISVVSNCQDVVIENLTGGAENPARRFPREFHPKSVAKLASISESHARACEFLARTDLENLPCGRYELPGSAGVAEIVERRISSSDPRPEALCNREGDTIFLMLNGSDRFRVCTGALRSVTTLSKGCPLLVPAGMEYEPFLTNRNRAFARACVVMLGLHARDFVVTDYGAAEGRLCTAAFAAAIAACERSGGGRIVVPPGTWLTGAIRLGSNCNLHLEQGATLEFTDDPLAYLPAVRTAWEGIECLNYSPLVYAFGATNVAITGSGLLTARTDRWASWYSREWSEGQKAAQQQLIAWGAADVPVAERDLTRLPDARMRPQFIGFNRCRGVRLEGFKLRQSPFWCIHMLHCEDVVLRHLDVYARGSNTDGANFESTRRVLVEDCVFDQGDDVICCKSGRDRDGRRRGVPTEDVLVRRCEARGGHGLFTMGSELSGGVRNVALEDCTVTGPLQTLLNVKTRPTRGGFVENVVFRRVRARDVERAMVNVSTRNAKWAHLEEGLERILTRIDGLTVEDVRARRVGRVLNVQGDPGLPISGLSVRAVSAETAGSTDVVENVALAIPPQVEDRECRGYKEGYRRNPHGGNQAR